MKTYRSAFTLVELSVVLVIMGILMGGIVKGLSMVENARLKRFKQDIGQIRAAAYTYYDRFGVLPGDDSNGRGVSSCDGVGNNDGAIALIGFSGNMDEQKCFWLHLYATGIMVPPIPNPQNDPGTGLNTKIGKKSPFGSPYYVWKLKNVSISGSTINIENGDLFVLIRLEGERAKALDERYDDGDATGGSIRVAFGVEYRSSAQEYVIWDL